LDICKNLKHIFIYKSKRIAPKTVLSISEKCTSIITIKIQNCEWITDKIINQLMSKYLKIEINKKEQPIIKNCFLVNEIKVDQAIKNIFNEI